MLGVYIDQCFHEPLNWCFQVGYMACDSFTANWQNELFESYQISPVQAMCGVNFFSFLLTSVSLLQQVGTSPQTKTQWAETKVNSILQGAFYKSLVFMSQFPKFGFDCVVLSLCSAIGNLFIYRTINLFGKEAMPEDQGSIPWHPKCFLLGPVVFIIIMTLRQVIAFLLSCVLYGHAIAATGILGVTVVFGATFLRIYCGYKMRKKKQLAQGSKPIQLDVKTWYCYGKLIQNFYQGFWNKYQL